MAVRVVTDSTSDLPPRLAEELGITVVPLRVNFGGEVFEDGIDLSAEEFYHRLRRSSILPTTSAPSPGTFTEVYQALAAETDQIVSIHISRRLSATFDAALLGKAGVEGNCWVEVVDSESASMGAGLLVIVAARAARAGADLDGVLASIGQAMARLEVVFTLGTMEYLYKGGRIGKAKHLVGTLLNIKPLLTIRDGEVHPLARVRTRARALGRMCELMEGAGPITDMAIAYSTDPDEAEMIAQRLAPLVPGERMYRSRFGPVLGTYVGPGTVGVGVLKGNGADEEGGFR